MSPICFRKLLVFSAFVCGSATHSVFAGMKDFKVTAEHGVDSSSLESIVRDAVRLSGAKTNDEKAIAIYEYVHQGIFHRACPTEKAPQSVGPLKVLNVYGWALCGNQSTILKALFETAGWKCRYVGWPGHTTIEVFYDGRWHYFDTFLKCYYWSKDKKYVVSQGDIAADPSLVLNAVKEGRAARENLCCGDSPEDVVAGCKARKELGDLKGWSTVTWRDVNYKPSLDLPSGASLRLDWKASNGFVVDMPEGGPVHTCGIKDFVHDRKLGPIFEHYGPRSWSNGEFVYEPDFRSAADLADIELQGAKAKDGKLASTLGNGVAIFNLGAPYPFVGLGHTVEGKGSVRTSFSIDEGKTWIEIDHSSLYLLRGKYSVRYKVEFGETLRRLRIQGAVEHNRGVLPYLKQGKNRLTVTTDQKKSTDGDVGKVTYVFQEANVPDPAKRTRWDGRGIKYGPVRNVTKEFSQTPFSFEIDVGGNVPPKMISMERSVRGKSVARND
jgi:hypothetical protein